MKRLISLEEHNRAVEDSQLIPNGIECPHCRKELSDINGSFRHCFVTGKIHLQNVKCKKCNFYGTRGIKKEPISQHRSYTRVEF